MCLRMWTTLHEHYNLKHWGQRHIPWYTSTSEVVTLIIWKIQTQWIKRTFCSYKNACWSAWTCKQKRLLKYIPTFLKWSRTKTKRNPLVSINGVLSKWRPAATSITVIDSPGGGETKRLGMFHYTCRVPQMILIDMNSTWGHDNGYTSGFL